MKKQSTFLRGCHVCKKVVTMSTFDELRYKVVCAKCSKIVFAVSVAILKINQRYHSRPFQIRISDIVKIISKKHFMRDVCNDFPKIADIREELDNPFLRKNYLDKEKINRCFDFLEEMEELLGKNYP